MPYEMSPVEMSDQVEAVEMWAKDPGFDITSIQMGTRAPRAEFKIIYSDGHEEVFDSMRYEVSTDNETTIFYLPDGRALRMTLGKITAYAKQLYGYYPVREAPLFEWISYGKRVGPLKARKPTGSLVRFDRASQKLEAHLTDRLPQNNSDP